MPLSQPIRSSTPSRSTSAATPRLRSVIAQYEPILHRAERLRFGSQEGRASVHRHARLIEMCTTGDVAGAGALAEQTWRSLTVEPESDPADPADRPEDLP